MKGLLFIHLVRRTLLVYRIVHRWMTLSKRQGHSVNFIKELEHRIKFIAGNRGDLTNIISTLELLVY